MNPLTRLLAILGITTLIGLAAVYPANAHEHYEKRNDPVTGGWCCTTNTEDNYGDCAVLNVEPGVITGEVGGLRLRLTVEQAQRINPLRRAPVDTFIPDARIQASWDGNWHACIPSSPIPGRADIFCFFMPFGS